METPFVLAIEDNEGDFALIEMALQGCMNRVQVCQIPDGEEAVTFFQESAPAMRLDLVILDLNLPRRNGLEVLEFMKSLDVLRDIPVVMFTSSSSPQDRKKALSLGADEYIIKPLSFDAMMVQLEEVCARYVLKANKAAAPSPARPAH